MNVIGYTEQGMIRAEIDGAEMFIPDDMENRHRQMIAEWEAAGHKIPAWKPAPPPVIVPETISDRQFFAVLEKMGRITYEEALQAVKTGDLPPAFEAFLASLDEDKQKSYRLFMEGETFFSRNHQITLDLAAFFKMTDPQVDAIFIEGDKL